MTQRPELLRMESNMHLIGLLPEEDHIVTKHKRMAELKFYLHFFNFWSNWGWRRLVLAWDVDR